MGAGRDRATSRPLHRARRRFANPLTRTWAPGRRVAGRPRKGASGGGRGGGGAGGGGGPPPPPRARRPGGGGGGTPRGGPPPRRWRGRAPGAPREAGGPRGRRPADRGVSGLPDADERGAAVLT